MLKVTKIVHENKSIIIPDVSEFQESDAGFLHENIFTSYLEQIIQNLIKGDLTFSCLYNTSSTLDNFLEIDFKNFKAKLSNEIAQSILFCKSNVNIIIIPIKLTYVGTRQNYPTIDLDLTGEIEMSDDPFFKIGTENMKPIINSHSNVIIIDNKRKVLEYFEPHGRLINHTISDILQIDTIVKKVIQTYFPFTEEYTFTNVAKSCPIGPQTRQNMTNPTAGHCLAWSLLYIITRILNSKNMSDNLSESIYEVLSNIKDIDSYIKRFMTFLGMTPILKRPYNNTIEYYFTNALSISDTNAVEKRLHYLVDTYFTKLGNYSRKDIDVLFEEICSYRHFPFFHNVWGQQFIQNTEIMDTASETSEYESD